MKLDINEKKMILFCLHRTLQENTNKMSTYDQDTDEYMELGNDNMLIETIINKLKEN